MGRLRRCEEMLRVRTKTNMSSKDFLGAFFFSPSKKIFLFNVQSQDGLSFSCSKKCQIVALFSILLILMRST